nr:winged helix-turn-helix domain-containing protein [Xylella fastidiosa]
MLLALLLGSLFIWHRTLGSVSVSTVSSPKAEAFYWLTRPSCSVGCSPAYYWTRVSCTLLFWAAFIMTRPIGAVVGDFLDKPLSADGPALSRYWASAALRILAATKALLVRPGIILSRSELEDHIYGWGKEVESNAVELLIHALQPKLGSEVIKNVRGADGWSQKAFERIGSAQTVLHPVAGHPRGRHCGGHLFVPVGLR